MEEWDSTLKEKLISSPVTNNVRPWGCSFHNLPVSPCNDTMLVVISPGTSMCTYYICLYLLPSINKVLLCLQYSVSQWYHTGVISPLYLQYLVSE